MLKLILSLLVVLGVVLAPVHASPPPGWEQFLADNVDEFENVRIQWEDATKIPEWLYGTYMKNGPARTSFGGEHSYQNQIDGAAKINKFHISKSDGVVFTAKFLKTAVYEKSIEHGDLVPQATLGPIQPHGWPLPDMREVAENEIMNTDITIERMGKNDFIASTDLNKVNVFDAKTLELKEFVDPFPPVPFGEMRLASCAHWKKHNGHMYNYDITWMPAHFGQFLHLYRFENGNIKKPVAVNAKPIKLPFQTLVHYFSITENYAVFFLYPIYMAIPKAVLDDTPMQNMLEHVVWEGDRKQTQILMIDLETGEMLKPAWNGCKTTSRAVLPPDGFGSHLGFYGTHHVNAYETMIEKKMCLGPLCITNMDQVVVTDVIIPPHYALQNYTDRTVLLEAKDDGHSMSNAFNIVRFTTSLSTYETTAEHWNDLFPNTALPFVNQFDFPNLNPNYAGKEYCFAYGQSVVNFHRHYLVKKDLCGDSGDLIWYKEHHYSGEPYFVPNPNATEEDDGVILNIVLDGQTKKSYLLVLDAKTMTTLTVAKLDTHIPMSIHGNWFDGEML